MLFTCFHNYKVRYDMRGTEIENMSREELYA